MIKNFNILLSFNDITNCYKNNAFPNAHCLLWSQETSAELLVTQSNDVIKTENNKGVSTDGKSAFYL